MEQKYFPSILESSIIQYWINGDYFVPTKEQEKLKEPYAVLMPPPNVTNVLHLGHALNATVQDIMVRYHRMLKKATIWKAGLDHAGIATENMVDKYLKEKGIDKKSLSREEFLKYVWDWKDQYGAKIVDQFKKIGSSSDWDHLRFTMDDVSQKAVHSIFIKLYNDNLIYRGEYLVNWCSHCLTALSDEEVDNKDDNGSLYYVKYLIKDSTNYLLVATTRPETIFGDVALAVNPLDDRYKHFIGKEVIVPTLNQVIPVISDLRVEKDFGTGVLKITPSHDAIDFEIGKENHLPFKEVINKDGTMNHLALSYEGKDRFEVRKLFVKELEEKQLLEEIKPHQHTRGVCYRCSTVIEPRISKQWFVKMEPLAKPALKALKEGKLEFTPKKWEKVYEQWLTNIKDWCISRQISWGHPIPAFHCNSCGNIMVGVEKLKECHQCQSTHIVAETDVLDTWFSSWIWPLTVFDWPLDMDQLKKYYPTQFLATAPEIIFFWVARMVMAGLYVMNDVPFHKVFFNSTICDVKGRKMSKSLGNGIDPIEIINDYGADAMRFTMIYIAPKGERIRIEKKSFDLGYRFINKLWNSARFILNYSHLKKLDIKEIPLDSWDFHILYQLEEVIKKTTQCYDKLDYFELSHILYQFFWNQFCDWYLESSKIKLNEKDELKQSHKYSIVVHVFKSILKLLHPIIPFVTEYLYQQFNGKENPLIIAEYPESSGCLNCEKGVSSITKIQEFITNIRNIRGDLNLSSYEKLEVGMDIYDLELKKEFGNYSKEICLLARFNQLKLESLKETKEKKLLFIEDFGAFSITLFDDYNINDEITRLKEKLKEIDLEINRAINKLDNKNFVDFADRELIEKEKEKVLLFEQKKNRIKEVLIQVER